MKYAVIYASIICFFTLILTLSFLLLGDWIPTLTAVTLSIAIGFSVPFFTWKKTADIPNYSTAIISGVLTGVLGTILINSFILDFTQITHFDDLSAAARYFKFTFSLLVGELGLFSMFMALLTTFIAISVIFCAKTFKKNNTQGTERNAVE
jgi:hypothetical protein